MPEYDQGDPQVNAIEQSEAEALHEAGAPSDAGTFTCIECSLPISLDHSAELPTCSGCGGTLFRRASMFEAPTAPGVAIGGRTEEPEGWLERATESITAPGAYLAYYAQGRSRVAKLTEGWSRIGRSSASDIRLDDPTVSRRHAVVVRTDEGELSALDDRSTNGVFVNGERVDWAPLEHGDEIAVGRYTLHVIRA